MSSKYYDAMGAPIDRDAWKTHRADPSYTIRREYHNGLVRVQIEWLGHVPNPDTWQEYWPMYRLNIFSNETGDANNIKWIDDAESGENFGTLDDANAAMDLFLSKWTECSLEVDEDGSKTFTEEGNVLAPPPAPNLDAPATVVSIGNLGSDVW